MWITGVETIKQQARAAYGCLVAGHSRSCWLSLQPIGCTPALFTTQHRRWCCSFLLWRYVSVMPLSFYFLQPEPNTASVCNGKGTTVCVASRLLPAREWQRIFLLGSLGTGRYTLVWVLISVLGLYRCRSKFVGACLDCCLGRLPALSVTHNTKCHCSSSMWLVALYKCYSLISKLLHGNTWQHLSNFNWFAFFH